MAINEMGHQRQEASFISETEGQLLRPVEGTSSAEMIQARKLLIENIHGKSEGVRPIMALRRREGNTDLPAKTSL